MHAVKRSREQSGAVTVLVVEDNPAVRRFVEVRLAKSGYMVLGTADGREALDIVREERPDVVILDWIMPGMQGAEVCELLKTDPDTADIPVIMLTGKSTQRDIEMGFEHGADEYLTKPFDFDELEFVLRRFVDSPQM